MSKKDTKKKETFAEKNVAEEEKSCFSMPNIIKEYIDLIKRTEKEMNDIIKSNKKKSDLFEELKCYYAGLSNVREGLENMLKNLISSFNELYQKNLDEKNIFEKTEKVEQKTETKQNLEQDNEQPQKENIKKTKKQKVEEEKPNEKSDSESESEKNEEEIKKTKVKKVTKTKTPKVSGEEEKEVKEAKVIKKKTSKNKKKKESEEEKSDRKSV